MNRDHEETINKVDIPLAQIIENEPDRKYVIPLDGKLLISSDPVLIGKNFRTYKNLRYGKGHPDGVLGMTKINSSVMNATYLKTRSAFHFVKSQPAESHLLVQAYSAGTLGAILGSASQVLENTTAIPTAGDFSATSLWTDSTGALIGNFSDAPNGQVCYCNGVDTCIWGGSEMKAGAFITSTAAVGDDGSATNPKDDTERMQNTKTDGDNLSYIGGGYDTYTKLLCHFNGADGDTADQTAATLQTIALEGTAQLDTAYKLFGTASLLLDGNSDYGTVPDNGNWFFDTGNFTIDVRYRVTSLNPSGTICGQQVDANNYWVLYLDAGTVRFKCKAGGTTKADYSWTASYAVNGWSYLEVSRNATTMVCYSGVTVALKQEATETTAIAANSIPDLATTLNVGYTALGGYFNGHIEELRISKGICRHSSELYVVPPTSAYLPNANYFLIGSPRPLKGIKPYVLSGNSVASTLTGSYWNGSSWASLTLTDNTDTGASLAQTGTVTFTSTVGTAKPRYLEGYFLYWYQFSLDAGQASLYKVTMDAPFQSIIDLWDGVYRDVAAAYKMNATAREDISNKVLKDDYDSSTADTYADISSMAAYNTSYLEFGFTERQCGLHFRIPPAYTNSTAATTMSIDYWNGTEYVTVGAVSDGTSDSAVSFAKSGTVTWNNADISDETKTQKMGAATIYSPLSDPSTTESIWGNLTIDAQFVSTPLYWYRVRFDKAMDATTRLNYVGGITSEKTLSGYSFSIHAAERLMLGCDTTEYKNALLISAQNQAQAFNGVDSYRVLFGDEKALTCGTSIFAQYASNIYNMALIFKANETWSLVWQQGTSAMNWVRFKISPNVGCPAPKTLKTVSAAFEKNVNATKVVAIWRGEDGIYISNGQAPLKVSEDLDPLFDQSNSLHVCTDMIPYETSFVDHHKLEYHWKWATDLYAITFTNGAHEVVAGDTITGNTSSATGIVDHVNLASGTWAGTAAGTIYMRSVSGTWQSAETIKEGSTTVATSSSVATKATYTYNSLDKEYILDLKEWKWFEIDRGTGKRLQLGVEVSDTSGNRYTYGFIDTGYMERLEYGTDFDGNDIVHTLETGDQLLIEGDVFAKTSVTRANLIALSKNTDSTVTLTHTKDGATSGTDSHFLLQTLHTGL
ncbi:MAG: LamG domain-containing protein [Clostridia bacterium]|jgi:hypothetical protein